MFYITSVVNCLSWPVPKVTESTLFDECDYGCFLWENPNPDFRIQKGIFHFWGTNLKTDHEPIKSTPRVGSSDHIQIWVFEIHNLSVFLGGKDFKKVFLTSGFSKKKKNGTQQMSYIYDILTEPIYVGGALTFSHWLHDIT